MNSANHLKLEHLFRNEYAKVIAILTSKYGTSHLEDIEDVVQETFIKAMRVWGYKVVPQNPTAWLLKVARNGLIDVLRKENKWARDTEVASTEETTPNETAMFAHEVSDSQLKMIFACCDPKLSQEYQLVLSLKLIGGFSNKELSEALLKKEETIAKAFTRAKKKFREEVQFVKVPAEMGLQSRLFVVLRVIYLLFSEGYSTTTGSQILKQDICYEALRLALLLRENKYCRHPNLEALIALMCFHISRFNARLDAQGALVSLDKHDRSLYDEDLIVIGLQHLQNAQSLTSNSSNYLFEAAVSYEHCAARTFQETNWAAILKLYDLQMKNKPSPMAALNRIVALQKVDGPKKALNELDDLAQLYDYEKVGLFYAIRAELLKELSDSNYASVLRTAIELTQNQLTKEFLEKKLATKS
ncbi:RNA polymerase sigma factor [Croceivirga thetidis]|uniref:RNA polymerase sigma factor n=1 Tax=Croceivirga thetidis TaxID=2721623 RepID=A0ABX1GPZ7_9FLAO|nr:sigma-70 family RNA polymerase sigma factor [Croceivirga thetidis]NKI31035.1 sigma-70 family RNA polymerase sigma factor [Croceivirga thetidis]